MSDGLTIEAPAFTRQIKGRRRSACYHEAGHLVARWYFGGRPTRAYVLSGAQMIAGDWGRDDDGVLVPNAEGHASGEVYGPDPYDDPAGIDVADHEKRRAYLFSVEVDMVVALAGPRATARYTKQSLGSAFLSGGVSDSSKVTQLAKLWFKTEAEQDWIEECNDKRCRALICSTSGWRAITEVAEIIYAVGEIDEAQADEICLDAFGHAALSWRQWFLNWPPSLDTIGRGDGSAQMARNTSRILRKRYQAQTPAGS